MRSSVTYGDVPFPDVIDRIHSYPKITVSGTVRVNRAKVLFS